MKSQNYIKNPTPAASRAHYFSTNFQLLKAQKKMCLIINTSENFFANMHVMIVIVMTVIKDFGREGGFHAHKYINIYLYYL